MNYPQAIIIAQESDSARSLWVDYELSGVTGNNRISAFRRRRVWRERLALSRSGRVDVWGPPFQRPGPPSD
eukprot:20867-Eustigmatos_ZCMA.PRE.1